MKKLSLILVALFSLGFVMAQNTATVNQSGDKQNASVDQSGLNNTATVDQLIYDNNVSIVSDGDNNTATVEQNGNYNGTNNGTSGNLGYIHQVGSHNVATLLEGRKDISLASTSSNADGLIDQSGDGNTASLTTEGTYFNFANHGITQIHVASDVVADGNTATVIQKGFNDDMDVHQKGAGNIASGTTIGESNQFFIDQDGLSNTATIVQTGNGNGQYGYYWGNYSGEKNWNFISQTGNNNTGSVSQDNNNKFKMTQKGGDWNKASIEQKSGSTADIMQDGSENILKGLSSDVATSYNGSTITLDQWGTANTLSLQQDNGATATVTQHGNNNTSLVKQN